MVFLNILVACFLITLCVWVAVFLLLLKREILSRITLFLISFSAGTLMGGAFLHLLPEAEEQLGGKNMFFVSLSAIVIFFMVEKFLHWRHCHKEGCSVHAFGYMNLIGDSVHNFIDGLVIAGAFMVDFKLGVVTTLAIALHEIPQEIGDFGVLLHAGFHKAKAAALNYVVALGVVAGGVVGYFISFYSENIVKYLLPFAAGGFIYIAAADLIPEIRKETSLRKSIFSFLFFILGILLILLIK